MARVNIPTALIAKSPEFIKVVPPPLKTTFRKTVPVPPSFSAMEAPLKTTLPVLWLKVPLLLKLPLTVKLPVPSVKLPSLELETSPFPEMFALPWVTAAELVHEPATETAVLFVFRSTLPPPVVHDPPIVSVPPSAVLVLFPDSTKWG